MQNEIRLDDNTVVRRTNIIGTEIHIYNVWIKDNPHTPATSSRFSCCTYIDKVRYGQLGTMSGLNRDDQYRGAYTAIMSAFPHLCPRTIPPFDILSVDMGSIETHGEK